jgi:hypothetical protein
MTYFFGKKSKTRLIPDPDFPPLHALRLDPEDQNELLKSFIEVWETAQNLGKILLSLQQAHDYHQRTDGMRPFLWLLMLGICAWVNVQAVRATIDNSLPPQLYLFKPFVTFALSLFLVFLLDWLIGSEIKKYLCWFDAHRLEPKLLQAVANAPGELNRAFALGQQEAFDRVQKRYLSDEKHLSRLKMAFLVVVYLIEIIAALHSITLYGESGELTAYIAPLLGVLFSGLSGVFRGITIEYPRIRHKICTRYTNVAEEQPLNQLTSAISFANTITDSFLKHGAIHREMVEKIRQTFQQTEERGNLNEAITPLAEEYHQQSHALTRQYHQDIEKLEAEEQQWQERGRPLNPKRKQRKFQKAKQRLTRDYLNAQLNLIEEIEYQLQNLYRRFPRQYQADCSFSQELAAKKREYQHQRSRLSLEGMIEGEESDAPKPFQESQGDRDEQDQPFDYS